MFQETARLIGRISSTSLVLLAGLLISIACMVFFADLAEDVQENDRIVEFDSALAEELYSRATPGSVRFFQFISFLGSPFIPVIGVLMGIVLARRREWTRLTLWITAVAVGELLNLILKQIFARARPVFASPLAVAQFFSFPSGHAMMSIITYGMMAYLLWRMVKNHRLRILIVFTTVLLVAVIGISRLYLGVHYFSDVVGGFAAGAAWLGTCIIALELFERRAKYRRNPPDPIPSPP